MASKELIVAPKAVTFGRTAELAPAAWSGPDRDPLLKEASIGNVLNALLTQARMPDRIVVVADNCTDKT